MRYNTKARTITILLLLAQAITLTTTILPAQATSPFDFTITSGPVGVFQGSAGSTTVTVTWTAGVPETVNLACTGVPSGAMCFLTPDHAIPSYTSNLTIVTLGDTAPIGTYTITVTGTSSAQTHATQFQLTIAPPPQPSLVGGTIVPVDKLVLLAPFIGLAIIAALGVIVYTKRTKHTEEK